MREYTASSNFAFPWIKKLTKIAGLFFCIFQVLRCYWSNITLYRRRTKNWLKLWRGILFRNNKIAAILNRSFRSDFRWFFNPCDLSVEKSTFTSVCQTFTFASHVWVMHKLFSWSAIKHSLSKRNVEVARISEEVLKEPINCIFLFIVKMSSFCWEDCARKSNRWRVCYYKSKHK